MTKEEEMEEVEVGGRRSKHTQGNFMERKKDSAKSYLTLGIPSTVARQAPLSMGFSKQECWSGLPCPLPGNLPNPRIEPISLRNPALGGRFFNTSATWEALYNISL